MNLLTVKELAAFLGMTESGVRQVVRRNGVKRRGTGDRGAALYHPLDILRHTGGHDRLPKAG